MGVRDSWYFFANSTWLYSVLDLPSHCSFSLSCVSATLWGHKKSMWWRQTFFHGLWAHSLQPNSLALHFIHGPDLPANEGLLPLLVDQPSILGSMIYRHWAQSLIYWWGPCIVALSCSSTFVRYSVGRNATKNVPIQLWILILLAIHQLWACPERTHWVLPQALCLTVASDVHISQWTSIVFLAEPKRWNSRLMGV